MKGKRLKVALVGCGQIADAHLQEARKIDFAEVCAVCDQHGDLAGQLAARFQVPAVFDDLERMLDEVRPDVLHVTTPPRSHAAIARTALTRGVHVYMEKPFTVDAAEADEVLRLAQARGRLICVGHDQRYDPVWAEARERAGRGEFGRIVHVDAVLGYDLAGPFGKVLSSDPGHWVHGLPGGLFQNTISHALYKITDFLPDEHPRVWATWFPAGHGADYPTDLRVMLRGEEVTANLVFLSQVRPLYRLTRLYGTRQCAEVDLDGRLIRCQRPASLPGPFVKLQLPARYLAEAGRALARNLGRFARSDLHYFEGMHTLFRLFYRAVLDGGEPPIPYREIHRVTAMMDDIFRACRAPDGPEPTPRANELNGRGKEVAACAGPGNGGRL